jgi:hypothetical protein
MNAFISSEKFCEVGKACIIVTGLIQVHNLLLQFFIQCMGWLSLTIAVSKESLTLFYVSSHVAINATNRASKLQCDTLLVSTFID